MLRAPELPLRYGGGGRRGSLRSGGTVWDTGIPIPAGDRGSDDGTGNGAHGPWLEGLRVQIKGGGGVAPVSDRFRPVGNFDLGPWPLSKWPFFRAGTRKERGRPRLGPLVHQNMGNGGGGETSI